MKVGIIGAGPAGLSCGLALARQNVECVIFEAQGEPGGLCRSFDLWGMTVDLGPHRFFSLDKKVTDFWLEQLGADYVLVNRLTRIFYKNKFFSYPIRPLDALVKLGPAESARCLVSYLLARFGEAGDERTFSQWVTRRFGKRLFEIFFKSYSEKLWGISCDELDASFAAQRIKGLNLYEAIKNALAGAGKTRHKTLVEQFAYPDLGAGVPYRRMAEEFTKLGGKIRYNAPILGITADKGRVSGLTTEEGVVSCDRVVSTMPFTELMASCPGVSDEVREHCSRLKYRNTIIVYLLIDKTNVFADNWIYVHSPNLRTGRITNFRNWSEAMLHDRSQTILALEYWANDGDALWNMSDASLEELAAGEMAQTGLVPRSSISEARVIRLHRSYPVYSCGYQMHLEPVHQAAAALEGLFCIGRNGAFKYNNQDHSILMGMLAAENILGKTRHDLWRVNTDYDYQESGKAMENEESKRK